MEEIREEEIQSVEEEINQVYRETQMQWTLTGEEERIEHAIIVESLATWPGIVGKETKQE